MTCHIDAAQLPAGRYHLTVGTARPGYRLKAFCHGLPAPEKRAAFAAEAEMREAVDFQPASCLSAWRPQPQRIDHKE